MLAQAFPICIVAVLFSVVASSPTKLNPSFRSISTACEERKAKANFVYGPCENECVEFNPLTFSSQFTKCAAQQSRGCVLDTCAGPDEPKAFSCQLNKTLIEEATLICPGDSIVFDSIDVNKFGTITYNVDLDAPPVQTDLYLVADSTGSMGSAIDTAKKQAKDIVGIFGPREDVAFGVGEYKDESELTKGFRNIQPVTENDADVEKAINKWSASGGGDTDEANLVALHQIATQDSIKWRQGARRFVVLFGDNPGHEPTCALSSPIDRYSVVAELNKKGITVVMVDFSSLDSRRPYSFPLSGCDGKTRSSSGQASYITEATGGAVVSDSDQKKLVELIERALRSVLRKYDVIEKECAPFLNAKHTPDLPLELAPTENTVVKNSISLKKESICGTADLGFECDYIYTESGAFIKGGVGLEFVNVRGC